MSAQDRGRPREEPRSLADIIQDHDVRALDVLSSYRFDQPGLSPVESPAWDLVAEAIGEALLHERAQLPPVVLGRCEAMIGSARGPLVRCWSLGFLTAHRPDDPLRRVAPDFLCPGHGAALERAVRRWPR